MDSLEDSDAPPIIGFEHIPMTQIDVEGIAGGFHGLTPAIGAYLLEGYAVTMKRSKHKSGVILTLSGRKKRQFELVWKKRVTKQLDRAWLDQGIATEHAAECLGVLIAKELTGYEVIRRSVKRTGFDFWLGEEKGGLFQDKARLECAGRFDGTSETIKATVKEKVDQMKQSTHTRLPGFASVTGFVDPILHFGKR